MSTFDPVLLLKIALYIIQCLSYYFFVISTIYGTTERTSTRCVLRNSCIRIIIRIFYSPSTEKYNEFLSVLSFGIYVM